MVTDADIPRKAYNVNLRYTVMDAFKQYCEEHGYMLSKRIEILMSRDMKK